MKRIITFLLTLSMVFAMASFGGISAQAASDDDVITIKMAEASASSHISCQAQNYFKEILEERSNGHFMVELYQDGTLGTELETWDMIEQGTIQMLTAGSNSESPFMPEYQITGACYVFSSYDEYEKVLLDETVLGMMNEGFKQTKDARLLTIWERGPRCLTANKEVLHPSDVEGMKVRVPGNEVYLASWESLGANIVSMPYGELYTALQQGTADAEENPIETVLAGSFYEVQDYLMNTNHVYSSGYVIINDTFFSGLSEEDQALIMECVEDARVWNNEKYEKDSEEMLQELIDNGMTYVEVDPQEWIDALAPLMDSFAEKFGWDPDFNEAVMAAMEK